MEFEQSTSGGEYVNTVIAPEINENVEYEISCSSKEPPIEELVNISKCIEQDISGAEENLLDANVDPFDVVEDFDAMIQLDEEFMAQFRCLVAKFLKDNLLSVCNKINDGVRLKDGIEARKLNHNHMIERFQNLGVKLDELLLLQQQNRLYSGVKTFNLNNGYQTIDRSPLTSKNSYVTNQQPRPENKSGHFVPQSYLPEVHTIKSQNNTDTNYSFKAASHQNALMNNSAIPSFLKRAYRPIHLPLVTGHQLNPMAFNNQSRSTMPLQFSSAPLPPNPSPQENLKDGHGSVQPPCNLSIVASGEDITLNWTLFNASSLKKYEPASHYEIFSYNSSEINSSNAKSSSIWKLIGEVRALALPMTCVIRDVAPGHVFYFAIYSVDGYGRRSCWSNIVQAIVS